MALRFEPTQQDVQRVQLPAFHDQALLVCSEEERDTKVKKKKKNGPSKPPVDREVINASLINTGR